MYNWQHKEWPAFNYDVSLVNDNALEFARLSGEITGALTGLNVDAQQQTVIHLMLDEAIKTSAIEGEQLSREDVRSSIENGLGVNKEVKKVKDKKSKAIASLMLEVRENYAQKLTESLIRQWHSILFSGSSKIKPGQWRKSAKPMQIISGPVGKEVVHFEAPPAEIVSDEMKGFVKWYNGYQVNGNVLHAVVKTALAHLYFESIHPFEDGNGRIGRAIAEKCLSESLGRPVLLSISMVLEKQRTAYYTALKKAQRTLQVNEWLAYFTQVIVDAQRLAVSSVVYNVKRATFFDTHKRHLNDRQLKVIQKMLDAGTDGFTGGMTARKYISITGVSKATATRDLQLLAELGVLKAEGEGRSVRYQINIV